MSICRFAIVAIASAWLWSASVSAQTEMDIPSNASAPDNMPDASPREQLPLGTDTRSQNPEEQIEPNFGTGSWGLQTAMALGVVVLLIFLLRLFLKRVTGMNATTGAGGLVDVLARAPIGPKTQVLFLKINHRVIVAGQTPAGINTLAEIDQPEEVAAVLAQVQGQKDNSISQGFSRLLASFDRGGGPDDLSNAAPDDEFAMDRARGQVAGALERLRKLKGGGHDR